MIYSPSQLGSTAMPAAKPWYLRIYEDLSRQILTGQLAPGDKLPTKEEIAKHWAVSVNPVERAIQLLQAAGLVETQQGRGIYVLARPQDEGTSGHD